MLKERVQMMQQEERMWRVGVDTVDAAIISTNTYSGQQASLELHFQVA